MTLGRAAGVKTCDDCGAEYAGPAYRTFLAAECVTSNHDGPPSPHPGCTENLCPRCAGTLEPDRADDPRSPARRTQVDRPWSVRLADDYERPKRDWRN